MSGINYLWKRVTIIQGFYLDYEHILTAHPPVRDRMLYGLHKIAYFINKGVSSQDSYFLNCKNFEELVEKVYNGKSKFSRIR